MYPINEIIKEKTAATTIPTLKKEGSGMLMLSDQVAYARPTKITSGHARKRLTTKNAVDDVKSHQACKVE